MSSENDARRREASGAEESSPHSGTSAPTPGIPAPGDVIAGIPAPGDVIAGKYEVERVLGSGGMGVVLAARHRQLGQRVAIKLLRAEAAFEITSAARFLREARSAVALTSEHVTKVLDIGELESGAPFVTPGRHGLRTTEILFALYRSADERMPVELSYVASTPATLA